MIKQLMNQYEITVSEEKQPMFVFRHKTLTDLTITLPYMRMMLKDKSLEQSLEYCYQNSKIQTTSASISAPYALICENHLLYQSKTREFPLSYNDWFKAMIKGDFLRQQTSSDYSPFFKMYCTGFNDVHGIPQAFIGKVKWDYKHQKGSCLLPNLPYFIKKLIPAQINDLLELGLEINGTHHSVLSAYHIPPSKEKREFKVLIDDEPDTDTMNDSQLKEFLEEWSEIDSITGISQFNAHIYIQFKLLIILENK